MARKMMALFTILVVMFVGGCAAHQHTVGAGPSTGQTDEARQWYILWGLVPLNDVDSQSLAGGAADYEIRTEQSFLDVVMNIFTSLVTVYSRTVTVTQ